MLTRAWHSRYTHNYGETFELPRDPSKAQTIQREHTAGVMPMDGIYDTTTLELLDEAEAIDGSPYRVAPLVRILDMKLALANSPDFKGDRDKHIGDAALIAASLTA